MPDSGTQNVTSTRSKSSRGFGAMDPEKQKEIAQRGGKAAHAKGVAHKYSVDEARSAGRKGGQAISANRAHMSQIGRLGGLARRAGRSNSENKTAMSGDADRSVHTGDQQPLGTEPSNATHSSNESSANAHRGE